MTTVDPRQVVERYMWQEHWKRKTKTERKTKIMAKIFLCALQMRIGFNFFPHTEFTKNIFGFILNQSHLIQKSIASVSNKGRQYDLIKMPRPCLYCLVHNHLLLIHRLTKKLPKASVLGELTTPQQRFIFLHNVFFTLFVEKRAAADLWRAEIRNYP